MFRQNALSIFSESSDCVDKSKLSAVIRRYVRLYSSLCCVDNPNLDDPTIRAEYQSLVELLSLPFSDEEVDALFCRQEVRYRQDSMWQLLRRARKAAKDNRSRSFNENRLEELKDFALYDRLVESELEKLTSVGRKIVLKPTESIAFVGGGAMPMSAMLIHRKTGLPVTCIDDDEETVELGREFISKCGFSTEAVSYRCANAMEYNYRLGRNPIVFINGSVHDKSGVMRRVGQSRKGKRVLAVRGPTRTGGLIEEPIGSRQVEGVYSFFDRRTDETMSPLYRITFFSGYPYMQVRIHRRNTHPVPPDNMSRLRFETIRQYRWLLKRWYREMANAM